MAVTLSKATDRDIPGVVQYQPSAWETDRRLSAKNPRVDDLPGDTERLYANIPDALRDAFRILAR